MDPARRCADCDTLRLQGEEARRMPVNGASADAIFGWDGVGTINTSHTFTKVQTFPSPVNILAIPLLQKIAETDDETTASVYVKEFVDNGVTKKGPFLGVAGIKVTRIVWAAYTRDCMVRPIRLILFF
jgi:hypothetical protein